jgi:peptidyl-prolyl cis-trans isomerase D
MLQDIRQNIQGTAAKIVVGLIVVSFSIFGIESILVGGGGGGVAEVNGEEITPQELQQTINMQKRRIIAMMGENVDPAMLDDQLLSGQAMESLISRKLLLQSATAMDMAVSEREIGSVIGSMEQFQVDGKFSPELYNNVLASAGYTPAYFKQSLRDDLAVNHMRSGLAGTEFSTQLELAVNARVSAEQRDLRYLTIPLDKYIVDKSADEAAIQAYYDSHQGDFRTLEAVELDYIELTPDDFRKPVEDSVVREAYQLEIENTQYQTESRVSHILFEERGDSAEESQQQRVAAAQAKLAAGADFAAVAAEFSDDVGSSASGGDLGYTSGDAFPAEMEQAIVLLEPGSVSEPVATDAGIHLILVTDRKEGKAPTLEEMRPALEEQLQLAQARAELLRSVETLKDLVFNAENLDGPATELELKVKSSDTVTRSQAEGLFAQPSLLAAAFSEDVLESRHNSDVIELGDNTFVVLRVRKHHPSQVKPLEAVQADIAAIIVDNMARDAVTEAAEQVVQQLRSGANIEQLATAAGYTWQVELAADRRNSNLPPEILQRAFQLPTPEQDGTIVDFVMSPAGDAQVISLVRVNTGSYTELDQSQQTLLQQQLTTEYASLLDTQFQRALRENADITVM